MRTETCRFAGLKIDETEGQASATCEGREEKMRQNAADAEM